jgi:hypothetical protein
MSLSAEYCSKCHNTGRWVPSDLIGPISCDECPRGNIDKGSLVTSQAATTLEIISGGRRITVEDVIKEANRNYDLGRKHGKEESRIEAVAFLKKLLTWYRKQHVECTHACATGDCSHHRESDCLDEIIEAFKNQ